MLFNYLFLHENIIIPSEAKNIIEKCMYGAIVKYVIQNPEFVKQEINPLCTKFYIVSKIIK